MSGTGGLKYIYIYIITQLSLHYTYKYVNLCISIFLNIVLYVERKIKFYNVVGLKFVFLGALSFLFPQCEKIPI